MESCTTITLIKHQSLFCTLAGVWTCNIRLYRPANTVAETHKLQCPKYVCFAWLWKVVSDGWDSLADVYKFCSLRKMAVFEHTHHSWKQTGCTVVKLLKIIKEICMFPLFSVHSLWMLLVDIHLSWFMLFSFPPFLPPIFLSVHLTLLTGTCYYNILCLIELFLYFFLFFFILCLLLCLHVWTWLYYISLNKAVPLYAT